MKKEIPDDPAITAAAERLRAAPEPPPPVDLDHNPNLELLPAPGTASGWTLVWRPPGAKAVCVERARPEWLLALKLCAEDLSPLAVARERGVAVGMIDDAVDMAVAAGILRRPPSAIARTGPAFERTDLPPELLRAEVFTLQWHITQACDLHCRHCYDRSARRQMPKDQGLALIAEFRKFCRDRHVRGQITFTGGNPLLHPDFHTLYQAAVDHGLGIAILGNPAPEEEIARLCRIAPPLFYQVSLEGLAEHNDYIRGKGHFQRVLDFLPVLEKHGIYSMVMLTLTAANQGQVLPLAESLRGRVDLFTFNRLAAVGEGAALACAPTDGYREFLESYRAAMGANPVMALKDNLFNILRYEDGESLFGGCAGHGCGAAFNFVSVLPDGAVHACRKFPSPIGHLGKDSLAAIYDSEIAVRYRQGPAPCADCPIRPACGGCLAVVHGLGHDPLTTLDPYCFAENFTESN